ncbi:MAG: FAD:protein FMN transferase [Bacilli bacterium]|jgi:thiamine biosynthesis lipoprotein ApbE
MKRFLEFIKQSWVQVKAIMTPKEWTITGVTLLLSGLLASSMLWYHPSADPDEVRFEAIGYNLKVKTESGALLQPFHTYYYVLYEKIWPQSDRDRVLEIIQEVIPPLHKISDRNNRFLNDDENPDSGRMVTIRDVNESYGSGNWLEINQDLFNILTIGKRLTIETDSEFNFFVGKLADYWTALIDDFTFPFEYETIDPYFNASERAWLEEYLSYIPRTEAEINATLELREEDGYFVRFNEFNGADLGDIEITLGGIAKGYANDVLSARLKTEGLTHGYISGGQSSNTALGTRYGNIVWDIPMSSPLASVSRAYVINRAGYFNISTSGGYEGVPITIDEETVWRHHIINPWDGYPSRVQLHVNVMSKDLAAAELDALSTALMNATKAEGMALRDHYLALGQELEIAWIEINDADSLTVYHTDGFGPYLEHIPENIYILFESDS